MARYTGPVCRLCRRETAASKTGEKIKLFLKGDRCLSRKCAVERRGTAPGQKTQANSAQKSPSTAVSCARSRRCAATTACTRRSSRTTSAKRARSGSDRPHVLATARTPSRQRRLPPEPGDEPRAGAPARYPPPLPRQRPDRQHPVVHRQAGRRDLDRRAQLKVAGLQANLEVAQSAASPNGSSGTMPTAPQSAAAAAREQIDTPVDEQLIVEYYSR